MALRRMLVILKGGSTDTRLLEQAFEIARQYGAQADAMFVRRNARSGPDFLGDAFSCYGLDRLLKDLDEAGSAAALAAKGAFETATAQVAASVSGRFIDFVGLPVEAMRTQAALSDVLVIDKPGPDGDEAAEDAARLALLEAGRPVLFLPEGAAETGRFSHVVAAFDGSQESARALTEAIDFLAEAADVDLVSIVDDGGPDDAADAAEHYLKLHGIDADRREEDRAGRSTGAALVELAEQSGADLLVMGGFGAPNLWETGGRSATRAALRRAPCAVLMTH